MSIPIFLDIETVQLIGTEENNTLFVKKFKRQIEESGLSTYEFQEKNAALYAEFSKVICIVLGALDGDTLKINIISGDDEYELLTKLSGILKHVKLLVAHNGKEFDYPYLFRRMIIKGIPVPPVLNTIDKKPWEVGLLDTMEMWSSTQWKYRCSLDLLCNVLNIPSPKQSFEGNQIHDLYFSEKNTEEVFSIINEYCKGDVVALAKVYLRIAGIDRTINNVITV